MTNYSNDIKELVNQGSSYLEAISQVVDENNIKDSDITKVIDPMMLRGLYLEIEEDNMLKPSMRSKTVNISFLYD